MEASPPTQLARESQTGSKAGEGGRQYHWATVRIKELQDELGHSKRHCKVGIGSLTCLP